MLTLVALHLAGPQALPLAVIEPNTTELPTTLPRDVVDDAWLSASLSHVEQLTAPVEPGDDHPLQTLAAR